MFWKSKKRAIESYSGLTTDQLQLVILALLALVLFCQLAFFLHQVCKSKPTSQGDPTSSQQPTTEETEETKSQSPHSPGTADGDTTPSRARSFSVATQTKHINPRRISFAPPSSLAKTRSASDEFRPPIHSLKSTLRLNEVPPVEAEHPATEKRASTTPSSTGSQPTPARRGSEKRWSMLDVDGSDF